MIKMTVDEAYGFDYYSILQIKLENKTIPKSNLDLIKEDLVSQVSVDTFTEVIGSDEYQKLLKANKDTFDAVDKAKIDEVPASYVDKCNYQRMIAKKKLQEKFFSTPLSEAKSGYEKYDNEESK
tara:strand:- start:96 stop:467 length:372 start_codon:yes stop_codon:yes gene_type:complete